jgi:hypothetical protein
MLQWNIVVSSANNINESDLLQYSISGADPDWCNWCKCISQNFHTNENCQHFIICILILVVFDPKSFKTIYFHRNECKQSYISLNIMKNVNAYKISHFSSCTVSCCDFISPHMSVFSLMQPLLLHLSVCITTSRWVRQCITTSRWGEKCISGASVPSLLAEFSQRHVTKTIVFMPT